ncbi:sigma-70 family RNA polymerase sigma factor [Pseudomonas sp. SID14000]|uniref:sigma-70 family RNA polymerase sigma factor n=1 Tax=Pseudomonas sp. SID14000 TaxID=1986221 RepID=UPI000B3D1D93|nr:sigma-70 family RNA polymerase sigma factor [Pseudomonas sp. SID14000]
MNNGPFTLEQQLGQLYVEHHSWLYSLLRRRLGNSFDAADLVHDVYLKLLKRGSVPAAEVSRCYLTQIAKGLVIDLYRRRRVESGHLNGLKEQSEPLAPSEEARALLLETLTQIEAALHAQPAKARQALLMYKLNGMAQRDIASELQVSVSSVEKYIASGLRACVPFASSSGA